jgi:hypothetical protein
MRRIVRRLALTLVVVAIMVATMAGGALSAGAQVPGQTVACAPWQQAWYISESGWWYNWDWRWCYNPSIQGAWYVDWAGWNWDGPAYPPYTPGWQYNRSA